MARRSTHRLLDEAKRAQAIADLRKNFSHVRDEREQQTGSDETTKQAAVTTAKAAATAPRPSALQTAARAQLTPNVNRQAGNPRQGQRYATKQAAGGVRHVYSDGTSVFVRKTQSPQNAFNRGRGTNLGAQTAQASDRANQQKMIQQIADQRRQLASRRRPRKGVKRTPMVS